MQNIYEGCVPTQQSSKLKSINALHRISFREAYTLRNRKGARVTGEGILLHKYEATRVWEQSLLGGVERKSEVLFVALEPIGKQIILMFEPRLFSASVKDLGKITPEEGYTHNSERVRQLAKEEFKV